ncbi:NAD(P)H-dependent oxidoreductase [Radiobacillus kanasensis]|uniref:NADPH-dependent FMN reductase n=1 Tax=Radiobacillus kanasensis TaxID=2844358 RepID=UPI001E3D511C|nr:NAD(P)H-dependent oxidoreductase [Radiobacillus kanasensis]UFU00608.1 NAD(P)H-dependent oxidoreductase [Radiobacillus kanasensis]
MKLLGVSGSLAGWKTNMAVHTFLTAAKAIDSAIDTELLDLRDFEVELVRGEPLAYYNSDTWDVVQKIESADIIVFATPIYQASMTGALKNVLDHLQMNALKGKVTGIITHGHVEKHFLVAEYQLKPILSYLKGLVPTTNIFVHNDSYSDENEIVDQYAMDRLKKLAEEMIQLSRK